MDAMAIGDIPGTNASEEAVNARLVMNSDQIADAVIALLRLLELTGAAVAKEDDKTVRVRGGPRRKPTPAGALIRDAINLYAELRDQYPESGPPPGFGGPMVRFIRSLGALAAIDLTDAQIGEIWRVRETNPK